MYFHDMKICFYIIFKIIFLVFVLKMRSFGFLNPKVLHILTFKMEKTLVILKPCTIQRGMAGEIVSRFEKKGLLIAGMKMTWLTDELLDEHYSHLRDKPFFRKIKDSMEMCPVVVMCLEGVEAISVVRNLVGVTNGRLAQPGTIRGDYSMSMQENIVHASDSPETAEIELKRFFKEEEIFKYDHRLLLNLYAADEFGSSK